MYSPTCIGVITLCPDSSNGSVTTACVLSQWAAYREATPRMRRQFNLAFFTRLLIWDDYTVKGELKEPFATLLGDDLRRIASAHAEEELHRAVLDQEAHELTDAIRQAERQRDIQDKEEPDEQRPPEPIPALVGAEGPPTPSFGGGFSPKIMVRSSGLEPPRAVKPTRPSTGFAGRRCIRGRPDRPICSVLWIHWTGLEGWMFSKCSHGRRLARR
jgi:site-specific DNA recombinase